MKITTDNKPRPILHWWDLTPKEQAEFDYLMPQEQEDHEFVRYRDWVYDLCDLEWIRPNEVPHPQRPGWEKWHAYQSDSFFSGVLFRLVDDGESGVVCGTYIC